MRAQWQQPRAFPPGRCPTLEFQGASPRTSELSVEAPATLQFLAALPFAPSRWSASLTRHSTKAAQRKAGASMDMFSAARQTLLLNSSSCTHSGTELIGVPLRICGWPRATRPENASSASAALQLHVRTANSYHRPPFACSAAYSGANKDLLIACRAQDCKMQLLQLCQHSHTARPLGSGPGAALVGRLPSGTHVLLKADRFPSDQAAALKGPLHLLRQKS